MAATEKSRLAWRCRRGTKEMDLLLQKFLDTHYDTLSPAQQITFGRLLDQTDPDIMDWITGTVEPPTADLKQLVGILRIFSPHSA